MAVATVRQLTERRGEFSEKNTRSYSVRYIVETSSKLDSVHTILSDPRLPQIGEAYQGVDRLDTGIRVKSAVARHVDGDPKLWHVDVRYGNIQDEDPEDPDPIEPDEKLPRISWRFDRVMEPVWGNFDAAGPGLLDTNTPMTNSKGQPFSPPVQYEVTMPTLQIRAWDFFLRTNEVVDATDVINDALYGGLAARTLKLNISNVEEIFREGKRYWQKDYELAYNPRTWDKFVLDYGYFPDPESGNIRMFLINAGGGLTTATSDANYIQRQVYREASFSAFRFIDRYVNLLGLI